jgi:dihydroorotate dehydrogenase electron transfer subunit
MRATPSIDVAARREERAVTENPASNPAADALTQAEAATSCAVTCRVATVDHLCREHVYVELVTPHLPPSAPGQFLQLRCRAGDEALHDAVSDWSGDGFPSIRGPEFHAAQPYLRRPFSIADRWHDDLGVHLAVISRAVGIGTEWLDRLRVGDTLDITGPLGNGFRFPSAPAPISLVGGGVGIPPLLYAARTLHAHGQADVVAIFGSTTRDLLAVHVLDEPRADQPSQCVALPGSAPYQTLVTSDDGSIGLRGRVTDGLEQLLQQRPDLARAEVWTCGPEPMLRAVANLTRQRQIPCQVCVERPMGCGLGTCLSCVIRRHDPTAPAGWSWALACKDGPVFSRDELCEYGPSSA